MTGEQGQSLEDLAPGTEVIWSAVAYIAVNDEQGEWPPPPRTRRARLRTMPTAGAMAEDAADTQRARALRLVTCRNCSMRVPDVTATVVTRYLVEDGACHFCCIDCLARWAAPAAGLRLTEDTDPYSTVLAHILYRDLDDKQLRSIRSVITRQLRP